ncbi:hypothetical protein CL622_05280 [archaeon]|nr:hypothetical protein [archaeon]|tara:strand:+ start:683 stop:1189 length:507 start_codon:yes stop_codon:yes gene_type:complete
MKKELITVSPNEARVRSIVEMVVLREKRIQVNDKDEFTSLNVEDYYEIIKELTTAIINLDGYKTLSHKALFTYLKDHYLEFSSADHILIDELRKTRNKIAYEGFFIKSWYLRKNDIYIKQIVQKLRAIIKQKMNSDLDKRFKESKHIRPRHNFSAGEMDELVENEVLR